MRGDIEEINVILFDLALPIDERRKKKLDMAFLHGFVNFSQRKSKNVRGKFKEVFLNPQRSWM